jgi:hypothetical protein
MQEKKRKELVEELMDKMFEIAGHDLKWEDMQTRQDPWYNQYTWTETQQEEWLAWGTKLLQKKGYMSAKVAKDNVGWLLLKTGLRTI